MKKPKPTKEQERIYLLEKKVADLESHIRNHKLVYTTNGLIMSLCGGNMMPIQDRVEAIAKHLGIVFLQEPEKVIAVKPARKKWFSKPSKMLFFN